MQPSTNPSLRLCALTLALAGCGNLPPGQVDSDSGTSGSTSTTGSSTAAEPTTGATTGATTGDPIPPTCGDGVIDAGEECDDGADNGPDRLCTPKCQKAKCGDGYKGPGEGCDDGNTEDGDDCTPACQLPGCGNGVVDAGEECDDGNADNSDACLNTCEPARCGDGHVHVGFEECDDGDDDNGDDCLTTCELARCGDGFVHVGFESCDDGDDDNSNGCLNNCEPARCGDGFVHVGVEACDDGNDIDNDGCRADCSKPANCSDGVKNGNESDVDCGGHNCFGCLDGKACTKALDCKSGYCLDGMCVTPRHCRDVRDLGLQVAVGVDGTYLVDPDGQDGPLPAIEVFCEMSFNGGGWQAVFNFMDKPIGEASAQLLLDALTTKGPAGVVLPDSDSPAVMTEGLVLSDFTEAVFGWAPTSNSDVTRYGRLVAPDGLEGTCYIDGDCGPGADVGEFDIVPTGNTRLLQTGNDADFPHVGLGFDNQIMLWGYDRQASVYSNWANWNDEVPCCKAGNIEAIEVPGWRYTIYLR